MTIQAMKQALVELQRLACDYESHGAVVKLRTAIEQAEKCEPVAWIEHHKAGDNLNWEREDHSYAQATPLYTHPQLIPEGWQLVPVEPTEEMIKAAYDASIFSRTNIYQAMLAAAAKEKP
jgi:hypothetical protein